MFEIRVFLISSQKPLQMCLSQILTKTPDFILHNLMNLQVDVQEIEKKIIEIRRFRYRSFSVMEV